MKNFRQSNLCIGLCLTGGWAIFTIVGIAVTSSLGLGIMIGFAGVIGGFFVAQWIAD